MSQELLASLPASVADALAPAVGSGVLRPLDIALVELLARHEAQCETTLILAAWCSQQYGNGHICLAIEDTVSNPDLLLAESQAKQHQAITWWRSRTAADLNAALQASTLVDCDGQAEGATPLVLDQGRLYLRRNWRDEVDVAESLRARLTLPPASAQHLGEPQHLAEHLDTLFPGTTGLDWQRAACALATRSALTLITGGPGTGKTTTVVRLLALLQTPAVSAQRPLRIRLAAPTGKAAARLTEAISKAIDALPADEAVRAAIPRSVTTLHKLLGRRPDSRRFRHHAGNPLHADLVVVDEASMIDLDMMASLLRALTPRTRLVLIGDKDQLASVEAGAVMGDLCLGAAEPGYRQETVDWLQAHAHLDIRPWQGEGSALAQQTVMLRTSHRFSADSGIGALADAVNQGSTSASAAIWNAGHQDLARISRAPGELRQKMLAGLRPLFEQLQAQRPQSADGVDAWARHLLARLGDFQLLCALRQGPAGLQAMNELAAHSLHDAGLINRTEGWYEGRPVMVTRNDYQSGLMNGDVGLTLSVPLEDGSTRLRVAFLLPDGSLRLVLPSRLDQVETTFAMTVHKSQGSEFDQVLLVLPDDSAPVVTRELLYTAITRARSRFILACQTDAGWNAALQQPTRRSSGLGRRLHGR